MKIGFASDHRGCQLKKELIGYFNNKGYEIVDCGTNSNEPSDYPDYAYLLGKKIVNKEIKYGVAICGSGIGISIACNKIKGVYCAKVNSASEAKYTRLDNNANCIAFSSKTSLENAISFINIFISTEFSNLDKHIRRINKVKEIERGTFNA